MKGANKMVDTIKVLASLDNETLLKAMQEVKASDAVKERAINSINDYKYARKEIAKLFGK